MNEAGVVDVLLDRSTLPGPDRRGGPEHPKVEEWLLDPGAWGRFDGPSAATDGGRDPGGNGGRQRRKPNQGGQRE